MLAYTFKSSQETWNPNLKYPKYLGFIPGGAVVEQNEHLGEWWVPWEFTESLFKIYKQILL